MARKRKAGNAGPARARIPRSGARLPAPGAGGSAPRRIVRIHNGHPGLSLQRREVTALIRLLDARAAEILAAPARAGGIRALPPGELSLALLTAPALARLHDTFMGDASPTDVITFPRPAAGAWVGPAGEICVSADAARGFAAAHRRDFSEELALYIVHGWLHLAGHDDRDPAARKRMRAAEDRALRLARAAGRIPRFTLAAVVRSPAPPAPGG